MKPPIMIAGAFVVGLGGATFVGMKKAPPAPAAVVAKAADSAATKVHADTVTDAHDSAAAPTPAPESATPAPVKEDTQPVVVPVATVPLADRVAVVFAKLTPPDIVPLVEHMSDDDLAPVLKKLNMTTAAAILALLPPPRAKILSKRLLTPAAAAKP